MSKIQKPGWTPIQLHENLNRLDDLFHETSDHENCQCNLCMEHYSLDKFIELFSEDEIVESVIAANKEYAQQKLSNR